MVLIVLVENLATALDNDNCAVGLILDIQKVFDTVDYCIPVEKLSFYGVCGIAHDRFYNYLSIVHNKWITMPMNLTTKRWNVVFHKALSWSHYLLLFLAATKQLYEWFSPSVRPSVCLSVRHTFFTMFHHRIIMKSSGVTTNDKSDVHAKGQCQRSKVKVTEVKTQLSRFWTITPVWIHIWWWNEAQSLMLLRRGVLLIFKVICQILRSHA